MKMNLPNKLTLFRVILVPIFVIIGYCSIPGEFLGVESKYWIMNIIFAIASFTDFLDGYIARKNNIVTTFGKFLDPLADKILVLSALVMLVEFGRIPAWIPAIVLTREFLVSGYRLIAVEKGGKVIAASIWGKIKTVTQMIAIILAFASPFSFCQFIQLTTNAESVIGSSFLILATPIQYGINLLASIFMLVSVVATVFSGWNYLKGGKELFKD
ncbi:MAG: CDP-diacylglycerol--glycerol-3-phosphate 3-phosphatidyltransferase [Clostridia bacterium]|nr:CDP-diacylglycerol--glycerol-3-phosphate 3-phosphatidyltransferase [Clostridia bacterium]